jgi:splicing suppressor protein 51
MYTREFDAVNDDRSMRQVTRMLTYPQTIASVLHELSPYSIRGKDRLTPEGLKSVSGIVFPCPAPIQSNPVQFSRDSSEPKLTT